MNTASNTSIAHYDYIDLLRGVAICGVLSVHSTFGMIAAGLTQLPMHAESLLFAGKFGVSLFFVLSAYTLMLSLSGRTGSSQLMFLPYFIRRFFRIAPAYYMILFLVFFLYGKGFDGYTPPGAPELSWTDLAAHMLFVNGLFPYYINSFIGVEWSIATEFMFYAALPFIFIWLRDSRNHIVLVIKVAVMYLASLWLLWFMQLIKGGLMSKIIGEYPPEIFGPWVYFFILSHIHEFVAGIAVWAALRIRAERRSLPIGVKTAQLALVGLIACGVTLAYAQSGLIQHVKLPRGSHVLWGILSAGLIFVLSYLRPGPVPGLSFLGKVSFSLYLVHMPIFYGLSKFNVAWRLTSLPIVDYGIYLFFAVSLSLAAATLLFHFVEKPGISLGMSALNRFSKPFFST